VYGWFVDRNAFALVNPVARDVYRFNPKGCCSRLDTPKDLVPGDGENPKPRRIRFIGESWMNACCAEACMKYNSAVSDTPNICDD